MAARLPVESQSRASSCIGEPCPLPVPATGKPQCRPSCPIHHAGAPAGSASHFVHDQCPTFLDDQPKITISNASPKPRLRLFSSPGPRLESRAQRLTCPTTTAANRTTGTALRVPAARKTCNFTHRHILPPSQGPPLHNRHHMATAAARPAASRLSDHQASRPPASAAQACQGVWGNRAA